VTENIPDRLLIDAFLQGDNQAFKGLVDRYKLKLVNICYGFGLSRQDAEDISQDVFVEVFQSLKNFRHEAKFSTWLYRVTVNKTLNHRRKTKRSQLEDAIETLDGNSSQPDSPDSADSALVENEKRMIIRKAMDTLPEAQRIAFVLHKQDELSYSEIAETMGVSVPAVESLMHRAKMNLQKKLVKYYSD
jgi:RNA polymerase sigma-70 factor, ECF subfamily